MLYKAKLLHAQFCLSSISVMGITAMSLAQGKEKENPCSGETRQAGGKGRREWFSLGGTGTKIEDCCLSSGAGPSSQLHLLRWGKRKAEDLTREPTWPQIYSQIKNLI